jgi:hypothetical protein
VPVTTSPAVTQPKQNTSNCPVQNADGTWTYQGTVFDRGHDAPTEFRGGPPPAKKKQWAKLRNWREWLTVKTRFGTPWGEPIPNSAKVDRWLLKIGNEFAAEVGVTAEEAAAFAELNRELIESRFAARTARVDVVQELHELMKAARQILAA